MSHGSYYDPLTEFHAGLMETFPCRVGAGWECAIRDIPELSHVLYGYRHMHWVSHALHISHHITLSFLTLKVAAEFTMWQPYVCSTCT